jgi:thiol-disulfide isomerase/thioredoxin
MKSIILLSMTIVLCGLVGCSNETKGSRRLVATDGDGKTVEIDQINLGVNDASGDFMATICIRYPDGTPAAGLGYRLELPLSTSNVLASRGTLSTNGEAVVEGLAGGFPPVIYYLYIDDRLVGPVAVNSKLKTNRFDGLLPAQAGMQAPDLALVDLATEMKFRLSDLSAQFVLLEFYTTHCAPCQPVLAKLNELLERRGAEWRDKVAILTVGLDTIWQSDSSANEVAEHLRRNGWNSLQPVIPDQEISWEPALRFPFGVNGVPYSFLIGREGIILWSGYPAPEEIEQRIADLLTDDRRDRH